VGRVHDPRRVLGPAYLDGTDLACYLKTKPFSL
jgi:hypothetical protein